MVDSPIKVLVVDTQPMLAEALQIMLGENPDMDVLEAGPHPGPEVINSITQREPRVALLDYWTDQLDLRETIAAGARLSPPCVVIVTSWSYSSEQIKQVIDLGAVGFLPKSVSLDELAEAVRRAAAGESPVFGDRLARLIDDLDERYRQTGEVSQRLKTLTPKELEVLLLLGMGNPPEEVAKQLSIKRGTVKVHIHNILKKTGARSHTEAVAMARYCGLLST